MRVFLAGATGVIDQARPEIVVHELTESPARMDARGELRRMAAA